MNPKPYGVNELREMFLSYFESKEHLRLPSFSLIPQNDKSLLLINSGMAPMKPYFKGEVEPPRRRVCTCQKCIRTGDIENIGKTARHGTYFEMLGNFSFGDYFKKEAIAWSWEFLTKVVGLSEDRLFPSIYENDEEAFDIWHNEIGIKAENIFRFGKKDNFWEHGSGPCGPCSEIYYDRGEKYGCGKPDCTVGCECDRYMEVWNNVFSQFDNDGQGNYTELVQKNIDTGMGLERLAVVCQDVNSLFDVDTVMNITNKVTELTGASYGKSYKMDVSLRVITDHIRASTFMIADGVLPSNEGRGYVLRRLLRRAARHGKLLGVNDPFLYKVVETVVRENESHYTYLRERAEYITRIVKIEEESFGRTIDTGMSIFNEKMAEHKAEGKTVFSGADAFLLSATYGFPIDLTVEMVEDEGMTLDMDGFNALREEDKVRAREARKALGDLGWAGVDLGKEIPETKFVGYEVMENNGKILTIVAEDEIQQTIGEGADAILVLDETGCVQGDCLHLRLVFQGDDTDTFAAQLVPAAAHGAAGPGTEGITRTEGTGFVDMPQRQIAQSGLAHLRGSNGAVGGTGLDGIRMEKSDVVFLGTFCPETFQKTGAVHAGVTGTVYPAIQFLQKDGFQSAGKNVDVVGPAVFQPGASGSAEIMIAGCDQYGNTAAFQAVFHQLHPIPGRLSVKNVTGKQHHLAVFPAAQIGNLLGQQFLLLLQIFPVRLLKLPEGRTQVPVGGVKNFQSHSSTLSAFRHLPVAESMVNRTASSLVGPSAQR